MTGLSRVAAVPRVVFTLWTKSNWQGPKCLGNTKECLECPESLRGPIPIFSSATVLIDRRDRHHCSVRARKSFRVLNRRKTSCIQTFLRFEHLPIFFLSFFSRSFRISPLSLSTSLGCDGDVSIFTGARSFAFSRVDSLLLPHLNLPYSSSRYVREHSPRYECRCALGRISPEEAQG